MRDDLVTIIALMRTTLDIDNDVLQAAKELAKKQHKTAGEIVSELLREAFNSRANAVLQVKEPESVYGFEPFPSRGGIVTNELIDELKDDLGV